MPYIESKEDRIFLDKMIAYFFKHGKVHGRLNYFIFKLVKENIRINGESYGIYKEMIGELEMCKLEIYRRMCALYEDKKIKENGDVE